MKLLKYTLLLLLTIILLAIGVIYYYSNELLEKIAISKLSALGFEELVISMKRPNLGNMSISEISMKKKLADRELSFRLKQLELKYSLYSLFKKELLHIECKSAQVAVVNVSQSDSAIAKTEANSEYFFNPKFFPLNRLDVGKLSLSLENTKGEVYKIESKLSLIKNFDKLKGEFEILPAKGLDFLQNVDLKIEFSAAELIANINLATRKSTEQKYLPETSWKLDILLKKQLLAITGDGLLKAERDLQVNLTGQYDLKNEKGEISILTNEHAASILEFTNNLAKSFALPLSFASGALFVKADLAFSKTELDQLELSIEADKLAGVINKAIFYGLTIKHKLSLKAGLKSLETSQFEIEKIAFGPQINDIKGTLKLSRNSLGGVDIKIPTVAAEVFGGFLSTKNLSYSTSSKSNELLLILDKIKIDKVLELYSQAGITATGALSGALPLKIDSKGQLSLKAGTLNALKPGGVIKYQSSNTLGATAGNEQVKLVSDLLSNFHYTLLTSGLSLSPNGDLKIGLKIIGNNPNMNIKRAVSVNLNVEENLPALLKSLRITSGIDAEIRKVLEN